MAKVRIVTDSNAYLPREIIERYQIAVLPQRLRVGNLAFNELAGFTVEDIFAQVEESQADGRLTTRLPEIVAPDLNMIYDLYQQVARESEQIVSIHMSSELSPMWQQARRAAELLKGRCTIRVIDSLSASFGLGLLVQKAAEAAETGANVHEVARVVNGTIPHLYLTIFSESLNYLERSAQISPSQSLLGTLLGIKAMLMMEEGKLHAQEKVQTREEVVEKLYEFVVEFARVEQVGVVHHAYDRAQKSLIDRLRATYPHTPIHPIAYPPSLAAHVGANALGVMVYEGGF
jgi:DegV family protein with EDD domain